MRTVAFVLSAPDTSEKRLKAIAKMHKRKECRNGEVDAISKAENKEQESKRVTGGN